MPLRVLADADQTGSLENLQVLGDRRLAYRERLGELGDRSVAERETRQDGAARRVGQREERGVERMRAFCLHSHVVV
jgi:hypothetical protein